MKFERTVFGPSGNSDIFYEQGYQASWQAPKWIRGMGLQIYEYSFGHGIRMREETAEKIRLAAEENGIRMSIHMPYYLNLSTPDPEKHMKNEAYFINSARMAGLLGAKRAVFHPGSVSGMDRAEALSIAQAALKTILPAAYEINGDLVFCPETMGKINQLGNLDEVLALCELDERLTPCLDFGHLHAREQGGLKTKEDFALLLDKAEERLGYGRASRMHIHFSRIEYAKGGEKRHRTFDEVEYGPEFDPLAQLLVERGYRATVVCESKGTMAEDAVKLQNIYEKCLRA